MPNGIRIATLLPPLLLLSWPALASQTPPRNRWAHEFTRIAGGCVLSDGSLLVSDAAEPAIVRLTFGGAAQIVGKRGAGPGEYNTPGACFLAAGDTALVFDRATRRFVVIVPGSGAPHTLNLPTQLGREWLEPRGIDDRGRVLLEASPKEGRAAILAWHPGRGTIDTVASIATGRARQMGAGGAAVSRDLPFSPRTAIVASPQIGIATVTAEPFAVTIRRAGGTNQGPPIPFRPVPVDDGDIEAYITANSPPAGTMAMGSDGRPRSIGGQRLTLANFGLTRTDFPTVKPAFDPEGVFGGSDGTVWLRMHRPSRETAERYEVWGIATASRFPPVTLSGGQRLLAVDARALYIVARDADDIEHVVRVPR